MNRGFLTLCLLLSCVDVAVSPAQTTDSLGTHFINLKVDGAGAGLLIANMAVEYESAHRWSVVLPVYFSGWNHLVANRKFRCFIVRPEWRRWITSSGNFYVGLHASTGFYNWCVPWSDYRYQDKGGHTPFFNAGLSIGFRHRLGHSGRWMLEYGIGYGYLSTEYDRYYNLPNGMWIDTARKHTFLIDQVNLSLVWHLPLRKGGNR